MFTSTDCVLKLKVQFCTRLTACARFRPSLFPAAIGETAPMQISPDGVPACGSCTFYNRSQAEVLQTTIVVEMHDITACIVVM